MSQFLDRGKIGTTITMLSIFLTIITLMLKFIKKHNGHIIREKEISLYEISNVETF